MKFRIVEERTYEADSEDLKEEFPEEYKEFVERTGREDDRAWVEDCMAHAGLSLFSFMDSEIYID